MLPLFWLVVCMRAACPALDGRADVDRRIATGSYVAIRYCYAFHDYLFSWEPQVPSWGQAATFQLEKDARSWWEFVEATRANGQFTWAEFKEAFNSKYFSKRVQEKKAAEFAAVKQRNLSATIHYPTGPSRHSDFEMVKKAQLLEDATDFTDRIKGKFVKKELTPGLTSAKPTNGKKCPFSITEGPSQERKPKVFNPAKSNYLSTTSCSCSCYSCLLLLLLLLLLPAVAAALDIAAGAVAVVAAISFLVLDGGCHSKSSSSLLLFGIQVLTLTSRGHEIQLTLDLIPVQMGQIQSREEHPNTFNLRKALLLLLFHFLYWTGAATVSLLLPYCCDSFIEEKKNHHPFPVSSKKRSYMFSGVDTVPCGVDTSSLSQKKDSEEMASGVDTVLSGVDTKLSRLLQKKTSSRWIASRSKEIGDSITLDDPFEEEFRAIRVFFLELKQKSWSPFLKQKQGPLNQSFPNWVSVVLSVSRPPFFDGSDYAYWKNKMQVFLRAQNYELWKIVDKGPDELPGDESLWTKGQINKPTLSWSAMNMMQCAIHPKEYSRVSSCKSAKEMWDKLQLIYEGTSEVRETKASILVSEYEMFRMKSDETTSEMFARFMLLVNGLKGLGKDYSNSDLVRKVLRSLPSAWHTKQL
ncbi:hypothetical protein Taro_054132 [Colocasia esculenta]|uniref:Retrotransposon gag domain-containing protein n=1 Tax=Colocasia esculenta TaxID=4460 RepID=A0A843XMQ7_COLES|nr:hypothetical protein [Colocasia esculenta]